MFDINNYGILAPAQDPKIFPEPVIELSKKLFGDEENLGLVGEYEDTYYEAQDTTQEQRLKQAELLDAEALKRAILEGEEIENPTANYDQALEENRQAVIRAKALKAATQETFTALRNALHEHAETIRVNAAAEYRKAETRMRKALTKIREEFEPAQEAYDLASGMHNLVVYALAKSNENLAPSIINLPRLNTSEILQVVNKVDEVASTIYDGEGLPAYQGVLHAPSGLKLDINLLIKPPLYDHTTGEIEGKLIMNDSTVITNISQATEAVRPWKELLGNDVARWC